MRVNGKNEIAPLDVSNVGKPVREPAANPAAPPGSEGARAERPDSVQISDAARARAAKLEEVAAGSGSAAELDPERAAEIRRRVLEGAYDSLDVVDTIARRILERGDV